MALIFVVEDEPAIAGVLRDLLEAEGYQVATAGDGHAALTRLAEVRPGAGAERCDDAGAGRLGACAARCRRMRATGHPGGADERRSGAGWGGWLCLCGVCAQAV